MIDVIINFHFSCLIREPCNFKISDARLRGVTNPIERAAAVTALCGKYNRGSDWGGQKSRLSGLKGWLRRF